MGKTGRALGAFIIVVGVDIFGTLTGYLANLFLAPRQEPTGTEPAPVIDDARQQLHQLKELVRQQQAAITKLEDAMAAD